MKTAYANEVLFSSGPRWQPLSSYPMSRSCPDTKCQSSANQCNHVFGPRIFTLVRTKQWLRAYMCVYEAVLMKLWKSAKTRSRWQDLNRPGSKLMHICSKQRCCISQHCVVCVAVCPNPIWPLVWIPGNSSPQVSNASRVLLVQTLNCYCCSRGNKVTLGDLSLQSLFRPNKP